MKNLLNLKHSHGIYGKELPTLPMFEWKNNSNRSKYNPLHLFETIMDNLEVYTHFALAKELDYHRSEISKIAHQKIAVSYKFILRTHEVTGIPIIELRQLMGDDGSKCFEPPVKIR